MARRRAHDGFREKQKVAAAHDLPGVPAGTKGRVIIAKGITWKRYRVDFENGARLSLLSASDLVAA